MRSPQPIATPARIAWLLRVRDGKADSRPAGTTACYCMRLGWTEWMRDASGQIVGEQLTPAGERVLAMRVASSTPDGRAICLHGFRIGQRVRYSFPRRRNMVTATVVGFTPKKVILRMPAANVDAERMIQIRVFPIEIAAVKS